MNNVTPLRPMEPGEHMAWEHRTPPHNVDAERALLGCVLLNNKAFDQVVDILKPEYFTEPAAQRVYAATAKLIEQGVSASPITLKSYLESDEIVKAAGGGVYLAGLVARAPTGNARDYAAVVADLYLRREVIILGNDIVNAAYDAQVDVSGSAILEELEERAFVLGSTTERKTTLISMESAADTAIELAQAAHRRAGALVGVTTGLNDLDQLLGGLRSPDLIILAGRPSMGKTSLGTAVGFAAARHFATTTREDHKGKQVAFFSLEMSGEQLATRVLAHVSNLDSHKIRTGRLSPTEIHHLIAAKSELAGMPFKIDDAPGATVNAIRTRARRLARAKGSSGLGLIVVDHLHLMSSPQTDRKDGRVQELGAMTRGLKALAKDLDVPVLCLCQLSRAVEQRDDKRPQLSDLRESGTIEQDADVVMFVFREQYYLERQEPKQKVDESEEAFRGRFNRHQERCEAVANIGEVIVAKQRHGPISTVKAHFDGPTTWFSDLARDEHQTRYMQGME